MTQYNMPIYDLENKKVIKLVEKILTKITFKTDNFLKAFTTSSSQKLLCILFDNKYDFN